MTKFVVFKQIVKKTARRPKSYREGQFVGIMNLNELITFKGSVNPLTTFVGYAKFE